MDDSVNSIFLLFLKGSLTAKKDSARVASCVEGSMQRGVEEKINASTFLHTRIKVIVHAQLNYARSI